ncbi:MAG: prolipoprotein diacylglyceryl transferase [Acidimicrobiales bacterium]
MGSFPIVWHLGPLTLYAYGVGIAVSFLFGAAYLAHRLERRGEPAEWVWSILPWVLLAAIAGARLASVLANAYAYASDPLRAVDFLHGGLAGLSSFGGIAAAVPTALWLVHRRAPGLGLLRGLDLATPVLVASWALARLVACQFMEAGGGPRTNAWYGLVYAGQAGRRIPVPLYQSAENWIIFALLLAVERWRDARGWAPWPRARGRSWALGPVPSERRVAVLLPPCTHRRVCHGGKRAGPLRRRDGLGNMVAPASALVRSSGIAGVSLPRGRSRGIG